jgi:hypothetical protein
MRTTATGLLLLDVGRESYSHRRFQNLPLTGPDAYADDDPLGHANGDRHGHTHACGT